MLTNKEISDIFKIPLGTVCDWGSRPLFQRPLMYTFLKVLPSEEFIKEVFNRKKPYKVLNKQQIQTLFNCKKSKYIDLISKFIDNLKKEEIEELLKRAKALNFLNNSKDLNISIQEIVKNKTIEEELKNCNVETNITNINIDENLFNQVLNYIKEIKKENPYQKITSQFLSKSLNINPITATKYLNIIKEKHPEIPIKTEDIIKKAIEDLKKENKKITIKNIEEKTGFSFATIQKVLKILKGE